MRNLLFVVVVACVYSISHFTDENSCIGKSKAQCELTNSPKCAWYDNYYGVGLCLLPCNDNISAEDSGNMNDSEAFVNLLTGSDTNDGLTDGSALYSIEQVKKCYGHNTKMTLAAGIYDLRPPANLSQIEEEKNQSIIPYFYIVGGGQDATKIRVANDDFQDLTIEGSDATSVICYVYKATFEMQDITVDVESIRPGVRTTLLWMHHKDSKTKFDTVKFNGTYFQGHVFIHTGGDLTLRKVSIVPKDNILQSNVIYWYGITVGAVHEGSWTLDEFQIIGPSENIVYSYNGSLFEQALSSNLDPAPSSNLKVTLENSVFQNMKWDVLATNPRRQKNAGEPVGLVLTVEGTKNPGQVTIRKTTLKRLDVSTVNHAAPLAIVSVDPKAAPVLDSLTVSDNKGNLTGGVGSNDDFAITGTWTIDNNTIEDANGQLVRSDMGTLREDGITMDMTGAELFDNKGTRLLPSDLAVGDKFRVMGDEPDDNKLPIYAVAIIIAVGVVVVAAIVVIVACAVYYRNKKYSTLSDEEYDESSSSSLKSSEKENEMDSA